MVDVVHVLHAINGRTIADISLRLAEQMSARGLETLVIASSVDPAAPGSEDVEVVDLGGDGRRTWPTIPALRRELRARRPSAVMAHAEGPIRATIASTRSGRHRPPVVGIVHNHYSSYAWQAAAVRRRLDAVTFRRLAALVGVSPGVSDDLRATFPRVAERVHTVPEPLTRWQQLPVLAAEPRDDPWFDDPRPTVVTVGHVHPRKDHATLVRAVAVMRDLGHPLPRVGIIGAGSDAHVAEVTRLIADLQLDEVVHLLGPRRNPMPYVADADVFVLSSRNEGLGIVLLEAMALGTPIVSTDAPSGPRWVLEDGRAGLLAPVGDHESLGRALTDVLHDADLRTRLVAAGRERVDAFTPAEVTDRYLAVLAPLVPGELDRG